ncbi:MAG: hypothetical protein AB1422_08405 [bacterium]
MQNYKSNFKIDKLPKNNAERKEIILLNFGKFAKFSEKLKTKSVKLKIVDS